MEQRNNLVLHGTETFSRGALDNVALESGAVVLDSSAGRYLPYGSYTTRHRCHAGRRHRHPAAGESFHQR